MLRSNTIQPFHVKSFELAETSVKCNHTDLVMMADDTTRKHIGILGEDIACEFLQRKGFRIVERNYRKPWGEIDIIAEKGNEIRFVEVKSISREILPDFSREMDYRPEELVSSTKLRKVARTAILYMESMKDDREYQIDVLGVIISENTRTARCRFFEQVLADEL